MTASTPEGDQEPQAATPLPRILIVGCGGIGGVVATQLNAAYHRAKYPTSAERMYAIEPEIEWYEDP